MYVVCGSVSTRQANAGVSDLIATLKACSKTGDLHKGRDIHAKVIASGIESNIFLASSLVNMYSKCGSMPEALQVFNKMRRHDAVSWNVLISGYADSGDGTRALNLFFQMQSEGCAPTALTIVAALKACIDLAAKEEGRPRVGGKCVKVVSCEMGKSVHLVAIKSNHVSHILVANTLINMYSKCGCLEEAQRVFDGTNHRTVVSWNVLILGYAENEQSSKALELFSQMDCMPSDVTFIAVLKACIDLAAKEEQKRVDGKLLKADGLRKCIWIHYNAARHGCDSDLYVSSRLVDLYAKCGSMVDAHRVFEEMRFHDAVSWNVIISGYADTGDGDAALQMFSRMKSEGVVADDLTLVAATKACISLAVIEEPKQVDGRLLKPESLLKGMAIHCQALHQNSYVTSTLVDLYAKCGSLTDARRAFDEMENHDVVSWTALVSGYAENGEGQTALDLFSLMSRTGVTPDALSYVAALKACSDLAVKEEGSRQPDKQLVKLRSREKGMVIHSQARNNSCLDSRVENTLIHMYAKCGSMIDARRVFDEMQVHDVVSWTALISGYAENGEGRIALDLYFRMQREGCAPNSLTYAAALKACSREGALETGRVLHLEICSLGLQEEEVLVTCLLDFYCKCGSMPEAQQVFDSLSTKKLVAWTAVMAGYSRSGDARRVFELFQELQDENVEPDGVTSLCVLAACRHAGLVDKGKEFFGSMSSYSKYGLKPDLEHYTCMVDMLGRANQLDEAMALIRIMPWTPDTTVWTAVLDACRKWGNTELARLILDHCSG